jgi:preprotein translocase subunit SecA
VESEAEKWRLVAECTRLQHEKGRPVLIGTRTVSAARAASQALAALDLEHAVLSAEQNANEAAIVAQAGQRGRITVATNMAGRGTDIRLGEGVARAGGLHVVMSEMHEAGRIDRQLAGRCARQGDPGSWEAIFSREDPLLHKHVPGGVRHLVRRLPSCIRSAVERTLIQAVQRRAERLHARTRRVLMRADDMLEDLVAFAGRRF